MKIKRLKNNNFIKLEIHTTQGKKHKVGVIGAGLEALRCSPR